MGVEFRVPWKESCGPFQYGLNMSDGANMVVLMVEDTLKQNGALALDGQNGFNAAKRQTILDRIYATFLQLALFVEV